VADGKLASEPAVVSRSGPAQQTLEQLLDGPKDSRHTTEIPRGSQLEKLSIKDGVATASLSAGFFSPDGGTGTLLRLAQVVYTLTQFPGVASVQFLREGQRLDLFGEGLALNRPLTRQDLVAAQL
jgi:spore germination protein GerM